MICWESIEENHIMMALLDHYLSSDDNRYYIWDSHLHWGEAETKIKPITLSTSDFPHKIIASLQIRQKEHALLNI